ncbi:MAG: nucleotidyl transferase AbiEii/AbiGii toxin family protein [Gammaproteobacteria bacterium]|nr:nucleotidyl transferase AbiEii/AbiGii toxin family protein [Gammaproteobacteria bacterium]MBP9729691.1 nucleotidyl transferase AbiEii/AbiGii toxin family protein [Gammaproteobacteria bacterium]
MAESWFGLNTADQSEALEIGSAKTGRPAHLLEKDIWIVWVLSAIYNSTLSENLTFKGGTSLSKVYKIIDRFSEDCDLTYDIRVLVPDLLHQGNPIPVSSSQEKKISNTVKNRLPLWIQSEVIPIIEAALKKSKLNASLSISGKENEKLIISYPALKTGTGYTQATIQLEFGARATGEPNDFHNISCDIESAIPGVIFPTARPLVMKAERTFWEKATAAHVFCMQGRLRGDRYARHWYDLAAVAKTPYYDLAIQDRQLAQKVAEHKNLFFSEKDTKGVRIDYHLAVSGKIQLIPEGNSLAALKQDYAAMLEDGLLALYQPSFSELMATCKAIENRINKL